MSAVWKELAAEHLDLQKQVHIWHSAEQSLDDMSRWLHSLLEQLHQAVNMPLSSAELIQLIARYQVCYIYFVSYSVNTSVTSHQHAAILVTSFEVLKDNFYAPPKVVF